MSVADNDRQEWLMANHQSKRTTRIINGFEHDEDDIPDLADVVDER